MAWSWGHTDEAYRNARAQLDRLPAEDLLVIAAEWEARPAGAEPDDCETFSHWHYVRALARLRRAGLEAAELAELIWDRAESQALCDNGGHAAWMCPFGCGPHCVPFDPPSPEGAEHDPRGFDFLPAGFELEELPAGWASCGGCGRAWNDSQPTAWTPTPAGRCPFEDEHEPEPEPAREVALPRELLARLMAAIETPDDLTEADRTALLEDLQPFYEGEPAGA